MIKVSGFTIVRNALRYGYPALQSIKSILPICDEFIANVGDSEDGTLEFIKSLKEPKLKIIENKWDLSKGKEILSEQTNIALQACRGRWAFYLQSDEVIHEGDLPILREYMETYLDREDVQAFRFQWLHFYGSYFRYRIDSGWFQKQDRIIRNDGTVESYGDAYAFRRRDGQPLKYKNTYSLLYHYGWVHSGDVMAKRRLNAEQIGFTSLRENEKNSSYDYGDLNRFPIYFGTHPAVMKECIDQHDLSQKDWDNIARKYWWHPAKILRVRYKTSKRIKYKIE